jgi:hypothetical protein
MYVPNVGDKVRIVEIGDASCHWKNREKIIGLEGVVQAHGPQGQEWLDLYIELPDSCQNISPSIATSTGTKSKGKPPATNFGYVKVEPVTAKPALTPPKSSEKELAWYDYCDQCEVTASGRPFSEHEGDLKDAFDYAWEAAMAFASPKLVAAPAHKQQINVEFDVGDEVVGIGEMDGRKIEGRRGVVRDVDCYGKDDLVGVEFVDDEWEVGNPLHDLYGAIDTNHGWHVHKKKLKNLTKIPF